ncbi:MAG TPA: hypothetical protein VN523_00635 [Hyphomicrobiaceae bacterium]|nr:hypothetical protein [Hyphomicrobiaceae bacterium]
MTTAPAAPVSLLAVSSPAGSAEGAWAAAALPTDCLSDKRILARIDMRSSWLISLTFDAGAIGDAGMPAAARAFLSFEPDCIDIASLNPTANSILRTGHRQAYSAIQHKVIRGNRQSDVRAAMTL